MNLKNILGIIRPEIRAATVCESCGNEFTCGASLAGCWCTSFKLTDETRKDLRKKFKNCLCMNCIAKYAENAEDK